MKPLLVNHWMVVLHSHASAAKYCRKFIVVIFAREHCKILDTTYDTRNKISIPSSLLIPGFLKKDEWLSSFSPSFLGGFLGHFL
ncbi:hypothetical protein F5Y05DRAFT_373146, partial [Hypoxylon sp. FL0543]